jgi:hypothetical protein
MSNGGGWKRSPRQLIHDGRQLNVVIAKTVRIMGRQNHLDRSVNIEPFRMVIHLFRVHRDLGHKSKRFIKIGKLKRLFDGVPAGDFFPTAELRQRGGSLLPRKFFCHRVHPQAIPQRKTSQSEQPVASGIMPLERDQEKGKPVFRPIPL